MPGEVIGPAVIDAGDLAAVPLFGQAQEVAAMGAAVDEGVDGTVRAARDDDRDLTDCRRDPIAGVGDFGCEAQIAPGRALEDALLLEPVLLGIGVDAEGNLAERVRREVHAGLEAGILDGHKGHPFRLRAIGWAEYAPRSSLRPYRRRAAGSP